jgi:hypothetical protein
MQCRPLGLPRRVLAELNEALHYMSGAAPPQVLSG